MRFKRNGPQLLRAVFRFSRPDDPDLQSIAAFEN
jgi:hypothetical protein